MTWHNWNKFQHLPTAGPGQSSGRLELPRKGSDILIVSSPDISRNKTTSGFVSGAGSQIDPDLNLTLLGNVSSSGWPVL